MATTKVVEAQMILIPSLVSLRAMTEVGLRSKIVINSTRASLVASLGMVPGFVAR